MDETSIYYQDWGAIDGDGTQSKPTVKASDSLTSSSATLTPKNSGGGADGWDTWAIEETVGLISSINGDIL